MKIFVKAKTNAKEEKIKKIDGRHFAISVKEPPVEGKANKAAIRVLAQFFNVSQADVKIISGHSSKNKVIEIFKNMISR